MASQWPPPGCGKCTNLSTSCEAPRATGRCPAIPQLDTPIYMGRRVRRAVQSCRADPLPKGLGAGELEVLTPTFGREAASYLPFQWAGPEAHQRFRADVEL